MNPNYIDSYSALFDVYFWADRHQEALELIEMVEQNSSSANEIADKIARARRQGRKKSTASAVNKKIEAVETKIVSLEQ